MQGPLTAPYVLAYTYTRSTGPIIGRFLGALGLRRVLGAKTSSGAVIVPPVEFNPHDGEEVVELVDVAPRGLVVAHTWVPTPRPSHLRDRPFAWVLVRLDGADASILHMMDAPTRDSVRTGMRVQVRWSAAPDGRITDIEGFEREATS